MAIRFGSPRADRIIGTDGNDIIIAGRGNDEITGGPGRDIFVFFPRDFNSGDHDRILDFTVGEDTIWFRHGGVHYSQGLYFEDYSDSILDGLRINAYDGLGQHLTIYLVGLLDYFQLPLGSIV